MNKCNYRILVMRSGYNRYNSRTFRCPTVARIRYGRYIVQGTKTNVAVGSREDFLEIALLSKAHGIDITHATARGLRLVRDVLPSTLDLTHGLHKLSRCKLCICGNMFQRKLLSALEMIHRAI